MISPVMFSFYITWLLCMSYHYVGKKYIMSGIYTMSSLIWTVPNFDDEDLVQKFEEMEVKCNSNLVSSISIIKLSAIGQSGCFFDVGFYFCGYLVRTYIFFPSSKSCKNWVVVEDAISYCFKHFNLLP